MGRRDEIIKVPDVISSGDGYLFIGNRNEAYDLTELKPIGSIIGEDGFSLEILDSHVDHEDGTPLRLITREKERVGRQISFKFAEFRTEDELKKAFGYGTASETASAAGTAFTSQDITLYGNRWTKLPYWNISVTSISTTDATPTTYDPAAIALNFDIDEAEGKIKIKASAPAVTPDEFGLDFIVTGTYDAGEKDTLENTPTGGVLDYYPVVFVEPMQNGVRRYWIYPKCFPGDIETIEFKPGQYRALGVSFTVAKDPTMDYLEQIVDEYDD